jgi:hypothetical protein
MMDGPFVRYVETVTGIDGLLSDPTHHHAGLHRTPVGGFTNVHTDFSHHPVTGLHHRVNVLLYLNPGWQPGWGGQLELWPEEMSSAEVVVEPKLGTVVIFATTDQSKHGLPTPVATPDGRSRDSFAFYYYSHTRPENEMTNTRVSRYYRRPGSGRADARPPFREWVAERLPPGAVAAISNSKRTLKDAVTPRNRTR